jgi:hypothetical protein
MYHIRCDYDHNSPSNCTYRTRNLNECSVCVVYPSHSSHAHHRPRWRQLSNLSKRMGWGAGDLRGPKQHMLSILGEAPVEVHGPRNTLIISMTREAYTRHRPGERLSALAVRPQSFLPFLNHWSMPQTPAESSTHANYQSIFDNALQEYEKKTRQDLHSNPLFHRLQSCDSPDDIIAILRQQIPRFDQSPGGSSGGRLTKWLDPTVKVINAFSTTIGGAVALVGPTAYGVTRSESAR